MLVIFGDGQSDTDVYPTNAYVAVGTFTVTLVVTNTVCRATDSIAQTVMPTVSLTELEFAGSVEVYPNPNNSKFNIDLDLIGGQDVQLVLTNTVGKVVRTKDLGNVGGHM